MSYDYNALVSQISEARRLAADAGDANDVETKIVHLQTAVDTFSDLSTKCPMTPLLWMQYAADTATLLESLTQDSVSALETRLQMLELALSEFPGSAILHVHYLQLLCGQEESSTENKEKVRAALDGALDNVGKGSHRNEGQLVAVIYRLDADFRAKTTSLDDALQTFYQRATVPMKDVNASLNGEFQTFCREHDKSPTSEDLHGIEMGRRYEAKTYNALVTCEDDVDAAMHSEGALPRHQVDLDELNWETILKSDEKTYWMGFGGMGSTNAFIQYAQCCYRYRLPKNYDHEQEHKDGEAAVKKLALCVFERGVAECPTVESLWLSYIRHLEYLVPTDDSVASRLKSVADRSVRNCPYSLSLVQRKLNVHLLLADLGKSVLDPDELMKTVQDVLDAKFITSPQACLDLQMTAIEVARRRILSLLAASFQGEKKDLPYDELETKQSLLTKIELSDASGQEVEDLCDDVRELYDAVDVYLRKNHSSWSDGRVRLWSDRAYTETHLLGPLADSLGDDTSDSGSTKRWTESIRCLEKLTKVHQPTHPDSYASYIQNFLASFPPSSPGSVLSKFRQTRGLYQKALKCVGKPKHPSEPLDSVVERDFEAALRSLCHEYLVFERYFGSDKSLTNASTAIQKKLAKATPTVQDAVSMNETAAVAQVTEMVATDVEVATESSEQQGEPNSKKRPQEDETDDKPAKKTKVSESEDVPQLPAAPEGNENTNMDIKEKPETEDVEEQPQIAPPPQEYKVKVGKLEYPAHPFTVRVSNLARETEDMDLVDTFRAKCGGIVHAKIIREKHHHGKGKSKGWGLVQFEERESVEKALGLSDMVGIKEKLVKIDRSHMPAAFLVPSGMHRVNPKGEGKSTKRNQKRKEQKFGDDHPDNTAAGDSRKEAPSKPKAASSGAAESGISGSSILAFKPRGVQQRKNPRKVKISLSDTKKEKS